MPSTLKTFTLFILLIYSIVSSVAFSEPHPRTTEYFLQACRHYQSEKHNPSGEIMNAVRASQCKSYASAVVDSGAYNCAIEAAIKEHNPLAFDLKIYKTQNINFLMSVNQFIQEFINEAEANPKSWGRAPYFTAQKFFHKYPCK